MKKLFLTAFILLAVTAAVFSIGPSVPEKVTPALGTTFAMWPDTTAHCYYPDSTFHGVSIGDTFTFDDDTTWTDTVFVTVYYGLRTDTLIVGEDTLAYPGQDSTDTDTIVPAVESVQSWPDFIITSSNILVQYVDTIRVSLSDTHRSEPFLFYGLTHGSDSLFTGFPFQLEAVSSSDSDSVVVCASIEYSSYPTCLQKSGELTATELASYLFAWAGNDTAFIDTIEAYGLGVMEWRTIFGCPKCARAVVWGSSDSTSSETGTPIRVVIPE